MPKSQVNLAAFDADGKEVELLVLSFEEYYEGLHDLIDDDEYRASKGIRELCGEIYDVDGELSQQFSNRYSKSGEYLGGRIVFADGTVAED